MPEDKTPEQTPAVEEMQKTLQEKEELLQKQSAVLNNPQVQAALQALADGKELVAKEEGFEEEVTMKSLLGKKPKDIATEGVDLDDLTNTELVDILSGVVEKFVGETKNSADKEYAERLGLVNGKIDKTNELLLGLSADRQVRDLASQHNDFDAFKPEMSEILKKYPNMALVDVYTLAKGGKVLSSPSPHNTESEKPESSSLTPSWIPVQMRASDGTKTKSDGIIDTPLRATSSNSRNFRAMVEQAAARRS